MVIPEGPVHHAIAVNLDDCAHLIAEFRKAGYRLVMVSDAGGLKAGCPKLTFHAADYDGEPDF